MSKIKILRAIYYNPKIGTSAGIDVTRIFSDYIKKHGPIYKGFYNDIFPDNFKGAHKELIVEVRINWKKYSKIYKEDDNINLLQDLNIGAESVWKKIFYNPYAITIGGGLAVFIIWFIISDKIPYFNKEKPSQIVSGQFPIIATSTIDVSEIFNKISAMGTSLERQNFLEKYKDSKIKGSGLYVDISKSADNYLVDIDVSGGKITCAFSADLEKKLLLLEKGQKISFSGFFVGSSYIGSYRWVINDCILE